MAGFTGSKLGAFDVLSSFVTYNAASGTFFFSGSSTAAVGTAPGGFCVCGVNRGAGTAGFAAISGFAPDNSKLMAALVPEPSTVGLLAVGLGAIVAHSARCRRRCRCRSRQRATAPRGRRLNRQGLAGAGFGTRSASSASVTTSKTFTTF